jgi:lactate dehydrogenase-like 2-hydroxyacid dehydrogenase
MKSEILLVTPVSKRLEERLENTYSVHRLYAAADTDGFIEKIGAQIRGAVVTGASGLPSYLWPALPALEIISVFGVGADKLDLEEASARGVRVAFTHGVLTDDVADLAIALWLAVVRRVCQGDRYVRDGDWAAGRPMALATKATGARVGILGLGQIGLAIARRAEAFAGSIAYHNRRPLSDTPHRYVESAGALARVSDVLFVAATGSAQTRNLVDAKVLEVLGPSGVLVNVARGAVVDEQALVAALQQGRLGGAGLDVFVNEPHVPQGLLGLDTVVLQPHSGSATEATRAAMADAVIAALDAHFGS